MIVTNSCILKIIENHLPTFCIKPHILSFKYIGELIIKQTRCQQINFRNELLLLVSRGQLFVLESPWYFSEGTRGLVGAIFREVSARQSHKPGSDKFSK